jgi:hypothetical protein
MNLEMAFSASGILAMSVENEVYHWILRNSVVVVRWACGEFVLLGQPHMHCRGRRQGHADGKVRPSSRRWTLVSLAMMMK